MGGSVKILNQHARAGDQLLLDIGELKQLTIPDGVEKIGSYRFYGSQIESVVIPSGVKEIGTNAFSNCCELRSVIFAPGSKLRTIGADAFSCCKNLRRIQFPDGLEKIGGLCFLASGLEEIVLPASMREIGVGAFRECKQLKSAQLNEGLEELGAKETINGKEYEGEVFY